MSRTRRALFPAVVTGLVLAVAGPLAAAPATGAPGGPSGTISAAAPAPTLAGRMVNATSRVATSVLSAVPAVLPTAYRGTVYLTFDDGPHPTYTPRVLGVLNWYGVKAVFFEVGQRLDAYPGTGALVRQYAHKVGNHTWSHPNLTYLSTWSVNWQLNRMEQELGYRPRCVRPPYGATNDRIRQIIADRGQRHILWTVDPRDWSQPGVWTIVNRVLWNVRDGSRILLHDGGGDRQQTVVALNILIPKLRAQGYVLGLMAC